MRGILPNGYYYYTWRPGVCPAIYENPLRKRTERETSYVYSFLYTITARKANTLYRTCTAQSLLSLISLIFCLSSCARIKVYIRSRLYNNKISRNHVSCCWFFTQVTRIFKFLFKTGHFSVGIFASILYYVVADRCCQSSSPSYSSVDRNAGRVSLYLSLDTCISCAGCVYSFPPPPPDSIT